LRVCSGLITDQMLYDNYFSAQQKGTNSHKAN